jgi:hypothetical protein
VETVTNSSSINDSIENRDTGKPRSRFSYWIKIVPFFVSAFLFLSAFFAIFSPLPLLLFSLQAKQRTRVLAAASNSILVFVLGGWVSFILYTLFVLPVALLGPYLFHKKWTVEKSVLLLIGLMTVTSVVGVNAYRFAPMSQEPFITIQYHIGMLKTQIQDLSEKASQSEMAEGQTALEFQKLIYDEMPSGFGIAAVVMMALNLLIFAQLSPLDKSKSVKFRPSLFHYWKTPELVVWPTIVFGAGVLFLKDEFYLISVNCLKVFLAFYVIQGMSVFAFSAQVLKLPRWLRAAIGLCLLTFVMPALLGLGFFDLWFNFRARIVKISRSAED